MNVKYKIEYAHLLFICVLKGFVLLDRVLAHKGLVLAYLFL
jgi:hypothetical protein